MTQNNRDYSFTQDNDQVSITQVYRVDVASGTLDQMSTRALATVNVAIGATRYSSTVKAYSKSLRHIEGVTWDVTVQWRTEQHADLLQNSASGTVIEKGMDAHTEHKLRSEHPTSGTAYTLGGYGLTLSQYEPQITAYWEKVHDSYTTIKSAATTLVGALNNATWNGYAAGTWLCKGLYTQTVRTESGTRYLSRYEFAHDRGGWGQIIRRWEWDGVKVTAISGATLASGTFDRFRNANFATYGFTF